MGRAPSSSEGTCRRRFAATMISPRLLAGFHNVVLLAVGLALAGCGGGSASSSAVAAPRVYRVTASAAEGGAISPQSVEVQAGQRATFTLAPEPGFAIIGVSGWGGSLNGSTFVTDPISADSSLVATFRDLRVTARGVVYERSDAIAYLPDHRPSSGVGGAAVSLRSRSTTTNTDGAFALPLPPEAKPETDDLVARATGYRPGLWPWRDSRSGEPQFLGLYPSSSARPRAGFVGGIIPHDVGGVYMDVYGQGLFPGTMKRGREQAGANLVALVDTLEVTAIDVAAAQVAMVGSPPWPNRYNPSISARGIYTDLVGAARTHGLRVMLLLQVYPDVPVIGRYFTALQSLNKDRTAFFEAWFAQMKPLVLERARVARDLDIEYLALGLNHYFINEMASYALWEDLLRAVRSTGYQGQVGLFDGSFDGRQFYHGRDDMLRFNRLFDFLGLAVYSLIPPPVSGHPASREQTRAAMRDGVRRLLDRHRDFGQPLFVLMGTPSVFGGASQEEYIEPCLACNSVAPARLADWQQQADAYQAVFEVINERPSGAGQVEGLLTWGYHYRDDPGRLLVSGDSAYDKSASIRGKPAEAVMRSWLQSFAP